ncbi:MAG TPA: alpha-amylase family glycosyl hydrolase [Bryobacteraceae bacterium]|nr:alpha-amylase family glycosyl hydrolase [Bryobacteraceae bacterium]
MGKYSSQWAQIEMALAADGTGCDAFSATVAMDATQVGTTFHWGVIADLPGSPNAWAIVTETHDPNSTQLMRNFVLSAAGGAEDYWLATGRRLGAQKYTPQGAAKPGIRFAVWAPNAQKVDVVFAPLNTDAGTPTGYISDDGTGVDSSAPVLPMTRIGNEGVWETNISSNPDLADFGKYMNRLYMFRIQNEQGNTTYKVDIFSRNQAGRGQNNPGGAHYAGSYLDLDGIVSCSVVSDPDLVTKDFADTGIAKHGLITEEQFWANEFTAGNPLPTSIEDLVIYELHVGSLGYGSTASGTFQDAMNFVDKLVHLGVNAVELLPVEESDGDLQWGYGTSLFFCMQTSQGGANQLKHFIRACHQNGIAVILDVVYNHYTTTGGERTEWGYDSDPNVAPQHNIWNWYQGLPSDYPGYILGGYLDNGSTGFAPRWDEEKVRHMFTSSAAALFDDFHIDGIRVDLTDAIHNNNDLHWNGAPVGVANQYGSKFLRELTRTVRTTKSSAFLIAEDYTGWSAMTQPVNQGGIGFDVVWYMDFYHNLIGDGNYPGYGDLLKNAGYGTQFPLQMDYFAGALWATQFGKVAYHESHDECGNDSGTERTIVTAVNGAPLIGATRTYAEGRCRFAFGMAALSAGALMFFMGEEVGAPNLFTTTTFAVNKVDLVGERTGDGRFLFRFYQDLIRFVRANPAARSRMIDVVYCHNANRVIVFTRTASNEELLILGSLNDNAFSNGYVISTDPSRLATGGWQEVFNSDALVYGGSDVGNGGAVLQATNGQINAVIPAHGFVVFKKVS